MGLFAWAELTKDKQVFTTCGFGNWVQVGRSIRPEANPIGDPVALYRCVDPICNTYQFNESDKCRICGSETDQINLYIPKGFVTLPQPRDYNGLRQRGKAISAPLLAFEPDFEAQQKIGGMGITVSSNQPIALVNDNEGSLLEFKQHYDKVVVTSENLYRDASWTESVDSPVFASGAIGTVFTTDVMSIAMECLANVGNGGTLDVDSQPSAVSAIASFAEFVKTALSVKLDIDPTELRLGRERVRTSSCLTERIFSRMPLRMVRAMYVTHPILRFLSVSFWTNIRS